MRTKFKKLTSVCLAVIMILSVLTVAPFTAGAAETDSASVSDTYTSGDFEYTVLDDGTASITGYTGSATELEIPSTLYGYTVTEIGYYAFFDCTGFINITIPNTVTKIGSYAFDGCTGLESITIPDSVTVIGDVAFRSCTSLVNITIPDSVTEIGWWAFEDCSSLASITISESVTVIGSYAFNDCTSLTEINVDLNNMYYASESGVLYSKDKSVLIQYPADKSENFFAIPNSITKIDSSAFSGCKSLTSITIPDSVTEIGNSTFSDCTSLASIAIPDSVTEIGNFTFSDCTSLESITISDSVKSIDQCAFFGCNALTKIVIPENVSEIGFDAFSDCTNLKEAEINSKNLKVISSGLFANCINLEKVNIPEGVEIIEGHAAGERRYQGAFENCISLKEITLPESFCKCYCWNAFKNCDNLDTVKILNKSRTDEDLNPPYLKCLYGSGIDVVGGIWGDDGEKKENLVIYGYKNSDVEDFAKDREITFIPLDEVQTPTIGDVDGDGKISIDDVTDIQKYIANTMDFTEEQMALADVDKNGTVSIDDVTLIQKHLAGLAVIE